MNEQTSLSSTVEDGIKYEEFYEHLFDTTDKNSSSIIDNNSFIPTHMILPFMIKPNSAKIFNIEQENEKTNSNEC